jgi:hypothetical protein
MSGLGLRTNLTDRYALYFMSDFETARQYDKSVAWYSGLALGKVRLMRKTSTGSPSFVRAMRCYPSVISERSPLPRRPWRKRPLWRRSLVLCTRQPWLWFVGVLGHFGVRRRGRVYTIDSAEKPSWSKNPKFLGDQITLPISQKPVHGHFRASFFIIETRFFSMLENRGFFSAIYNTQNVRVFKSFYIQSGDLQTSGFQRQRTR